MTSCTIFRARCDSLLSAMGKNLFVISVYCISVIFSFYATSETDQITVELAM